MRIFLFAATALSVVALLFFVFGSYATNHLTGSLKGEQRFEVLPGENALALGTRLEQQGIVFSRYAFFWYLVHEEKNNQIIAGQYAFSGNMTIPEVALLVTSGKTISRDIRVTFPEGWTIAKMAERLTVNGLPGKEFLLLAGGQMSSTDRSRFDFLADVPLGDALEGYLFPDTYQFAPEATAADIVNVMLQNFGKKYDATLRQAVRQSGKNLRSFVTMASIIEEEGRTREERDMISDIFWKRIKIDQALQSDATVNYVLGTTNLQPTLKDISSDSPYNTYKNKGLPPGPISNPSLESLHAAIFPKANPYYYFLVDLNTGETFYAKTFDEHVRNRTLHGL